MADPATTAATEHHIEPETGESTSDSSNSDLESLYESEQGSITDTLASYAKRYTFLNNRRYDHKQVYFVANDEEQQDQMDLFHEIYFRILGNKLFRAPIAEKPQRVLDLGTGTGIWAVDFADSHPSAQVVGNDISPIQPSWVPANCQFEVDDFNEASWTYTPNSFDFVHVRGLHSAVKGWDNFIGQIFKILKPGGWLEIVGEDVQMYAGDGLASTDIPCADWTNQVRGGFKLLGYDPLPYNNNLKATMEAAGFDMSTFNWDIFPLPIGIWPKARKDKELGGMNLVNFLQGIDGWSSLMFTKVLGMSDEEYQKNLAIWKASLKDKKQHIFMKVNNMYVQKPLET